MEIIIIGDVNADVFLDSSHPEGRAIALALTTNVNFIANCYVNISAVADHCLVVVTLKLKAPNPRPFYIFTRSYQSYNPESWVSELERVPFHVANIFDDFNENVDVFNK